MHIEKVEIHHLLGFQKLSLEVDPSLQLIAGPNNAGKSSFIRVLEAFFSDPTADCFRQMKPLNDYYVNGGPRMLSRIIIHFGGLTSAEADDLGGVLDNGGTFWVQISCTRAGTINYRASNGLDMEPRDIYDWVLQSFDFVKIPSIRVSDADQGDADQSMRRLQDTLEGVLISSGRSRSTQLQRDFAEVMEPVEKLVREVLGESVNSVASELPFRDPELGVDLPDPKHALRGMLREAVITSQENIVVPISERGTGFQSLLILGILRYVSSQSRQAGTNVIFAIEEPEAFLHPQTQRAMAKVLRDISAEAQLLVTTHSPVIVDSFSVSKIARLPLHPEGMKYTAVRSDLTDDEEGLLTRYCNATNSELVFASAVILVEGLGDKLVIDYLLGKITSGPGGHYALGITVIEATGINTIKHLLGLAQLFGVRAYVLTDKDGVHKSGNSKRALGEVLKAKDVKPNAQFLNDLHQLADKNVNTLKAALQNQEEINEKLKQYDAFVLSSDLEGLLLDVVGAKKLAGMLGPEGERLVDRATAEKFAANKDGKEAMASYIGSKGWNSKRKPSNKVGQHVPSALLRQHIDSMRNFPVAVRPLRDWLKEIVDTHKRAPV